MSVLNKFIEKIDVTNTSNSPFNDFAVRLIGLIEKTGRIEHINKLNDIVKTKSNLDCFIESLVSSEEKTELQKISDYSADHYQQLMASILPVLTTLE